MRRGLTLHVIFFFQRDVKLLILDLSNNDLGPIGVSYIAEMLQENRTLLDLVGKPLQECTCLLRTC